MSPERWRQIETVFHAALEREPAEREIFLSQACPEDDLRREVEELLAQALHTNLLDRPVWAAAAALPAEHSTVTVLAQGTQLGPYKIVGRLGAGGMGEVFRAVDTRLGRPVAIKTSQERFSERFEREARAISALNHPNVCTLYDVGPNYLVMELVDGETLAARIKRGRLSSNDVLKCGAQIADAVAAAHAKGIIHRDLKPQNIMLAKSGIKVLDFGLAKSPLDATLTASRAVMGTPAYMAPEQLEGKAVDYRSDIYAFGLVLYEMATGNRLPPGHVGQFDGMPAQIGYVIERCLQRQPDDRWQSAADVRALLQWTQGPAPAKPERNARLNATLLAVASVAILAAAGSFFLRPAAPASEAPSEFTISFGDQMAGAAPLVMPVPSPDGRSFVIPGRTAQGMSGLWIRALNSTETRLLPGTEDAEYPIWSPDSRWIGFYADGKLKKISPSGGQLQTIAALAGFQDADWGSRGDILFRPSNRTPFYRIRDSGGPFVQATRLNAALTENSHRGVQFLPDGHRFIFTARCAQRANDALYLGSLDSPAVKRLMALESNARYVPGKNAGGVLVYYRDGGLWAQSFDIEKEVLGGEPVPVVDHVSYIAAGIQAGFRVSNRGNLTIIRPAGADQTRLVWFERNGEESGTVGAGGGYQPRISPDGSRVAFTRPDPQTGNRDVFSIEIARGVASRLTTDVANDWFPVWAPDGRQLLFGSDRDGGTAMLGYLKTSMDAGSGEARFSGQDPVDWSRDGRWIVSGTNDIMLSPASANAESFPFLKTPFVEGDARFSPDGKWLAYSSNESGRFEVYVRPFNGGPAAAEGKIQISEDGGDFPVWRPQGGELYYMAIDGAIFVANTDPLGRSKSAPKVTRLFRACPEGVPVEAAMTQRLYGYSYDTHDGQRFLVNCSREPPGRFTVLLNWPYGEKQ